MTIKYTNIYLKIKHFELKKVIAQSFGGKYLFKGLKPLKGYVC